MKRTEITAICIVTLFLMFCTTNIWGAIPMGSVFTYQGRLMDTNDVADGLYDFEFGILADPCTGTQMGPTLDVNNLDVIDGYFTVELDFGIGIFGGDARWLEICVRPGELEVPNIYTVLSPRQEITPTPYALSSAGLTLPYADSAAGSGGPVVSITNTGTGSAIKGTGQNGCGVQGESFAAGSSGVFGTNNSTGGYGVFGWSDSGTAVKGFSTGTGAAGLFQIAGMGNSNAALEGRTNSTGTGIFGWATAGGGTNYGVRGRTESAAGYAGYFEGRVYASDNVGIGTETPNYKLEVKAPTNQALKLSTESTNSNVDIQAEPTGSGSMRFNVFGGANAITFNVNNTEKLRMNSNGDVGIGTNTPTTKLDVTGSINTAASYRIDGQNGLSISGQGIEVDSVSIGPGAGANNTGSGNTFSGHLAGYFNTTGYRNTFSGAWAGRYNTTGSFNTFLGYEAGYKNTTGAGNVFIGFEAGYFSNDSNELYIDNSSTFNPLIYGDFDSNLVEINGTLDVKGPIWQRGAVLHADYVFEPGYKLESIDEHSQFMWQNKHLAAIPKAMTDENGIQIVEIGAHRKGIVEELEKAHIYIDHLHKQNIALEKRLVKLEAIVAQMSIAQKGK